ncbi:cell division protein [Thioflavicoccus mobilis 8321]|uniref:Cell division protein n=1 Tax=Thioflavicoccus mobilis 8321 TaxID=765912 RepID=L0GUU5_9GAMM|nr:SPOR domain-containing protein [Thioflavicoccus mobilis]AGA90513.1 cell division protein [Thioflavicoccus mobilis 8321]
MTLDYRRGSPPPRPKRREPKPCFFWFVLGGMLGAFGVGLAWTSKAPAPHAGADDTSTQAARSAPAQPSFYFYDILPEMEVPVPDEEEIPPAPVPSPPPSAVDTPANTAAVKPPAIRPTPPSAAATGDVYLLQVASFRRPEEATRLKQRLAALGIQAQIQTVTINNKDTYHRVRTGPLASREQLSQVRDLLRRNGLESIAIKVK